MFGARSFVAFALACALLPAVPRPVAADAPVPLDYKAYDGWNRILTPKLSDDGRKLAYALTPQDGDGELVVRNLKTNADIHAARAELTARGVDVGEVQVFPWGEFLFFEDPDGNRWSVQAIPPR